MSQHKVIYDTDPGVDDAMALVFQALHPDIELLGLTSVFGNATIGTTTRNARFLAGRFAPGVPVAQGAAAPLKRAAPEPLAWIHGDNGLGNIAIEADFEAPLDARPAHRFIIDTVRAHPGEVTLIAVGPLTNLALALADDPQIALLVKQVVIMGGAFGTDGVLGNVTPAAEANILGDPDAADIVLGAPWPVAIVGLDVTQRTIMSQDYLASLRDRGGAAGQFVWDVSRHYEAFHEQSAQLKGIYVHDSSAVAYVLAPHLYTTRSGPVRVLTDGIAVGQAIQKPSTMPVPAPDWDGRPECAVCLGVDVPGMLALYERTICGTL
ncbi:nucleoside hydrolase [Paraburkholderia caffeinilytica]|uniref:Inosine-uridine preferring nucleoside hydrolase n=1 Tax=Paraburkholderia caffeinilytica TaxID=1761016 RepID=A0ABQ1N9Z9_9BURK|nr:nucleoside hydrolase [Paraburkholderia caffeinilytica]AXL48993.1 nucleoside hydrolase [Paraburkholderia caffeinilytica]GGC55625.1 inosine-uridine preferring nucleoside hydrolase [Paraburkholderia caffeinilytica]CAB3785428.1 Pyrimidine-specific ribonucleoside hydrolase RihB [Paraburkholderia caffeinilytica]